MERETSNIEDCGAELEARFGADVLCDVVVLDEDRDLWPEERAIVALATAERRREFAAGRNRARELLCRLGFAPVPILRMGDRTPLWPRGAIGSIAHSRELCAVAIARAGRLASLGVDTEPDEPLEEELWETVCTPRELSSLAEWPRTERGRAARIYFSAKESTYKCLYPLTRTPLEMHDVEIELDERDGSFRACVSAPIDRGRTSFAGMNRHSGNQNSRDPNERNRRTGQQDAANRHSANQGTASRCAANHHAPNHHSASCGSLEHDAANRASMSSDPGRRAALQRGSVQRSSRARDAASSALRRAELSGFCMVRAGSIFTGMALPSSDRYSCER